jgi:hypothetical protein
LRVPIGVDAGRGAAHGAVVVELLERGRVPFAPDFTGGLGLGAIVAEGQLARLVALGRGFGNHGRFTVFTGGVNLSVSTEFSECMVRNPGVQVTLD